MPMIAEEEINRVKQNTDLAAVVRSRGVELKKSGHDLVGLCPFHDDHTPSLRVTAGKGLWRCMSCGAAGNVIQFVQKFDGVSFRHALELLSSGKYWSLPAPKTPIKKALKPRLDNPLHAEATGQAALRQVVDYYHARLKENPLALDYLKKRGLASAEAIKTFRIGFADRTLGLRLPRRCEPEGVALRSELVRLGVCRESGQEHLRFRVVFPIIAEDGVIGTLYGRAISADIPKPQRHLFLPGPQRGVWNPAALRSPEVIVTEGIIDALTFWCAGFRNVTAALSAKAFADDMLAAFLAARVRRVLIAFDRDEQGERGASELAAQLNAHGIETARVLFPHGKDANAYALAVTPPEKSLGVLLRAAVPLGEVGLGKGKVSSDESATTTRNNGSGTVPPRAPSSLAAKAADLAATCANAPTQTTPNEAAKKEDVIAPTAGAVDVIKNEIEEIEVRIGDRVYRVRGLAKNSGFESLRVSLRVLCGERWHMDTLDLCVARQREAFVAAAATETALKSELLKRDLGRVLLKLEELHEARLRAAVAPVKPAPTMSEAEQAAALTLLRDPRLLERILADFAACGVVGEETNKLVGYLAAISRKLDAPLAVIVQSTSAAGKTALMEAVLSFVPSEERVKYSALTGQALYYMADANLKHKILAIVEEEGAEKASYALKLLQSEGELTIASTGKDPHTGRMETQEYRVEGPVMIFLTTTAVDIDEELLNRCLVLTVDEGREQTAAIHKLQRERETLAGLLQKETRNQILNTHRAAQRLLRPLHVVNPFAEKLTFLDDRTRTRRDHGKYLALIRVIALLHQHQREIKTVMHAGKRLEYIEATLEDIAAANRLAHEVLGRCLDEMPPQTRRLLVLLEKMVSEKCRTAKMEREDVMFSRRQVREFSGWGDTQLKVHLGRLSELEYLVTHRAEHGQGFVYELVYDGGGKDGKRFLSGLLDVETLRRSGVNGEWSGSGRPPVGVQSGASRPAKNAVSSSEKRPTRAQTARNAHQGGAAVAAA